MIGKSSSSSRSGLGTCQPWKEMVQLRSLSISANSAEAFQKIQNPRCLLSDKLHHRHSLHPLRRGIHTHPQVLHHILHITTWSNLSIILLLSNSIASDPTCPMSRPKTHSKGVTVISHLKPEGLKYNLTQTIIL